MIKETGLAVLYKDFVGLFVFSQVLILASAFRFKRTIA